MVYLINSLQSALWLLPKWYFIPGLVSFSYLEKKKRQAEEEVRSQYKQVDRDGFCQQGQLKTGPAGERLSQNHLWCKVMG